MSTVPRSRAPRPQDLHVGTIAHEGLLWDTYLEFDDDPRPQATFRGRLRFDVAGAVTSDGGPRSAHTTIIIIEDSHEGAVAKARAMDDRVLESLLRSALPDGR